MTEQELYKNLKSNLKKYVNKEDINTIDEYYTFAKSLYKNQLRDNGITYLFHCLSVALYLSELNMDIVTIGTSLLHEAFYVEGDILDEIKTKFGDDAYSTLLSLKNIEKIKSSFKTFTDTEKYRRIIVNLSENPSSIIIKLTDRLLNLHNIDLTDKERVKKVIEETNKVYIPIAHRLGIKKLKSELEDVCLKISKPKEYNEILEKLNASRKILEENLQTMRSEIEVMLKANNIKYDISSRVKSVKGIYNKLSKGKKWEQIYDFLGLRVIVNNITECYLVIGLVHAKYRSLPHRFKDYIANSKDNMYQSLHTTVFGTGNMMYEIQVRTHEMDEIAEHGIAAHWSYKEHIDAKKRGIVEDKLEAFRSLIEVNDQNDNVQFFKNFNEEINKEEIYCFTPKGDVIELPKGATPLDFAYKIHSEIGNTTTGALVNGKIVKLNYVLQESDVVEIKTKKGNTPSKAWLKIVVSDQAKSRIKSYFYKKERDKLIETGKTILENELKKHNLMMNDIVSNDKFESLLKNYKLSDVDELYISIATIKYTPLQIINRLFPKEEIKFTKINNSKRKSEVIVNGYNDILSSIANCCNPVYGEPIVGYITRGEGVRIHSISCKNIDLNNEKIVAVEWAKEQLEKSIAKLKLQIAKDADEILDIFTIAKKLDINVISFNKITSQEDNDEYLLNFKVGDITKLKMFMEELKKNKNIKEVMR